MTRERADVGLGPDGDPGFDLGAGKTGFRAFVLSDIRGYSSFASARGDEAAAALTGRFIAVAERVLGGLGGESIGNRGDEVLFAFESPRQAIRAAIAFEQALLDATREDPSLPLPAGVGIDVGEAVMVPDGWRANAINVAARLCSLAKGGEILATREGTHLAQAVDGIGYTPRPATRVKGIAEPVNVVRVVADAGDTMRGFAELGLAHAAPPPARRRARRGLASAVVAAAALVAAAVVLLLAGGGASSASLAANQIGVIATGSGQVTQALPVGAAPTSVASGDGSTWVVSASTGNLYRIYPKTGSVTQIPVGSDPVAVTVAADGSVWVANSGAGTVSRVSPENNRVVETVRVGAGPTALAAASGAVWVANTLNGSVTRIDLATGRAITRPVGSEPAGIAAGGGSIWVANEGDGTVYTLNPGTGAQVGAPIAVGNGPTSIAFGDGAAWVANNIDGTLSRIDEQTSVVTSIHIGQGPFAVVSGPRQVWVSDEYGGTVAEVDPATLSVTHRITTNNAPVGLALAGNRLWVATDGVGAAAHRGGVVYGEALGVGDSEVGPAGDVSSIDPDSGSAYTTDVGRLLVMTSDGLVGYRRTGGIAGSALVPDLAVALPVATDNGLTYTFRIRSGIRYSDGVVVRASDFRRGLERAFRLGAPVNLFPPFVGVRQCTRRPSTCNLSWGVVADDAADAVTFHLTAPDPDLLYQLTLPATYPVPPGTPMRLLRGGSVLGTGPYEISVYSPVSGKDPRAHGRLVLRRNPYFRQWSAAAQPAGFPDRIVVRTNYSQAQQVAAVERGRADFTWDVSPTGSLAALAQSWPTQLHEDLAPQTNYLWLNVHRPPFNSLLARKAINYAVDRNALERIAAYDLPGRPTCQVLPPNFPGYVPYCPYTLNPSSSGRWLAPDLAKAQALVRQSGTLGDRVLLLSFVGIDHRLERLLVSTLRSIGYRAQLKELSQNAYFGHQFAPAEAGVDNWIADYVAPSDFFTLLAKCGGLWNFGGFCDPRLDARMNQALAEQSPEPGLASERWTAIDRAVVDQAVDVPISNPLYATLVSRRVGNYQYNPQWGVLIDELWVR